MINIPARMVRGYNGSADYFMIDSCGSVFAFRNGLASGVTYALQRLVTETASCAPYGRR